MKVQWHVVLNGRLPAYLTFDSLDAAVAAVVSKTGESEKHVRENLAAGCPTMINDDEYDIEKTITK